MAINHLSSVLLLKLQFFGYSEFLDKAIKFGNHIHGVQTASPLGWFDCTLGGKGNATVESRCSDMFSAF